MGLISSLQKEDSIKQEESKENNFEKIPKDSIKRPKNNKKPKHTGKANSKTIINDTSKNMFTNKIIKTKKTSQYNNKTFSMKRSHSKEKPKVKIQQEIKKIIFQNRKMSPKSQNKRKERMNKKFDNKNTVKKQHNINYNHFSHVLDDEPDIIYNTDDEDFMEDIIPKNNNINNNQNKILKEKINNTKKKIINLRKKLNTEINNSSKNLNVKNTINNNIIVTNNHIKPNKISNTLFINNSNITISNSNRNYTKQTLIRKDRNLFLAEKNNNITYNTPNLDSIEIDDIFKKVFPPRISHNNKIFTKLSKVENHYYYTEYDLNFNTTKAKNELSNDLSLSQNETHSQKRTGENIINKMEELKEKIKSKINDNKTPSHKNMIFSAFNDRTSKKNKKNETLDNKHIKKNIPSYRRSYSKSNNFYITTNPLLESLDASGKVKKKTYGRSLFNSNIKNRRMKSNYNFSFKRRIKNKSNKSRCSLDNNTNISDLQLDISSTNNITSTEPYSEKRIKNKRLFNIVCQNIKKEDSNKDQNDKDINNIDNLLILKYRDAVDIDISSINKKESLIDEDLFESNINNKIVINFSKLENITTSQILFDGIIYKVADKCSNDSDKQFKMMERYFQLKKNCFRYFNNIQLAKYNKDKPLVQFDIRHIQDMKIVDNKIFEEYDLNGKKIEFCFSIFLNQNSDFFVFVLDNENFGNSLFGLMNLLKNYYEDKKDFKE